MALPDLAPASRPRSPTLKAVAYHNTPILRFIAGSILLHIALFWLIDIKKPTPTQAEKIIAIAFKPEQVIKPEPRVQPKNRPAPKVEAKPQVKPQAQPAPTKLALRDAPIARKEPVAPRQIAKLEPPSPSPKAEPPKELVESKVDTPTVIVKERPLPTVKELLPSAQWAANQTPGTRSRPIPLNTKDPDFVTYFTRIKQIIDREWKYPELALQYRLQGILYIQFTINKVGHIEEIVITKSSGSQLLDQEALRAVRAVSPFPALPPWIKTVPLTISARMLYEDGRLNN